MKNWKNTLPWIPFIGTIQAHRVYHRYTYENGGPYSYVLQLIYWTFLLLYITTSTCKGQSFELINQYPWVVTSIKYDGAGNEYVSRQQGSLTKNEDTIKVFQVKFVNESGLIDFDFAPNGFFLHLTSPDNAQRIIEYDTTAGTLDTILEVPYTNPAATIHRGGSVIYNDSVLYCSFGDGANPMSAQNFDDFRGKLIKIPQMSDSTWGFGEIVLFGLRNPFRFSFNPGTNEGFVADVGDDIAEEVNYFNGEYSLLNLGWPCYSGDSLIVESDTLCGGYAFSFPEYQYSQAAPRAIIGGCFWNDKYYFCDNFSGFGGSIYLDSVFHVDTFPIVFPEGVTSMTVNSQNELIVSTWIGDIYKYVQGSLSIDEDSVPPVAIIRGINIGYDGITWDIGLVGRMIISSMDGRMVYSIDLSEDGYFDTHNLPNGMYGIAVYTDRGIEYSRTFINIR